MGCDAHSAGEPSSSQAHTSKGSLENGSLATKNGSPATENGSPDFSLATDPPRPPQAQLAPLNSEPSSAPQSRSTRACRPPAHLGDYICYNTRCKEPPLACSPTSKRVLMYVLSHRQLCTCANFSVTRKQFLAAITKVTEPRYYHEVAKDPRWRDAMHTRSRHWSKMAHGYYKTCQPRRNPSVANGSIVSNIILMDPFSGIRLDW